MAYQNPEALRAAAAAIEVANQARANAANANQEAANQVAAEAAALAAAGIGGAPVPVYYAIPPIPPVAPAAPVGFWAGFDRFWVREYHWNWATAAFVLGLAAFLLALMSTGFSFSLANTKASEASVIAVGTTAVGAAKDAAAANAKADVNTSDIKSLKGDLAKVKDDISTVDKKVDKLASVPAPVVHRHYHPVKIIQAPPAPQAGPAQPSAQPQPVPQPQSSVDMWKWRYPDSSTSNPKPCVVEHLTGEPTSPFCSELRLEPRLTGDTRQMWASRVTEKMGLVDPHKF